MDEQEPIADKQESAVTRYFSDGSPNSSQIFIVSLGLSFLVGLLLGLLLDSGRPPEEQVIAERTDESAQRVVERALPAEASDAQVEALVRQSLLSWQSGNLQEFTETAHQDLVFAFPGRRTDADGAVQIFNKWRTDYEDIRVYIHQILVDGDRFAAEYQFANTLKETGRRSVAGTVAVGRVQDGKIILLKEYLDGRVSRGQEAGLMPLDEGEEPYPWPPIDLRDVLFEEILLQQMADMLEELKSPSDSGTSDSSP